MGAGRPGHRQGGRGARRPHARLLPASTLKTLTALTLIPEVSADRKITATQADANADGTRVGIVPGLPYTARQLFQALLMSSGNDAAYALAEAGGGREATLTAMNEHAAYLGAHDTGREGPVRAGRAGADVERLRPGPDRAGRVAAARTSAPTSRPSRSPSRGVDPKTKKRATYMINNHNKLLYNYDGTIGIKNGYTEPPTAPTSRRHPWWQDLPAQRDVRARLVVASAGGDVRLGVRLRRPRRVGGRAVAPGTVTTPPTRSPARPPRA